MSGGEEFSFPTLPPPAKVPLTAMSTVTDMSRGAKNNPKPVAVTKPPEASGNLLRPGKVVPLAGYSQMDWMGLCKRQRDLTGGVKFRRDLTMEEVAQHNKEDDAWIIIRRKVYNLTPYLRFHPGGVPILKKVFGKDGTKLFAKYHPWVNVDALMQNCWVGMLDTKSIQQ